MKQYFLYSLVVIACLSSCKKEETPEETPLTFGSGLWICNEGSFGNNNASLSFLSETGQLTHTVFSTVNNQPLGDVAQSIFTSNGLGFVAVNGSQKVEIYDLSNGQRKHTVTGLDYPRQFAADNSGTVYVSNGSMAGQVYALDVASGQTAWSVTVGNGPEAMAVNGNHLAVCNSGGWTTDHTVSIVDLSTQQIATTIEVGDRPVAIEIDGNGDYWVLCSGETLYDENWQVTGHTPARLVEIDGNDHTLLHNHIIGSEGDHPTHFTQDENGTFYVLLNGIQTVSPITGTLTPWVEGSFYSLNIHPETQNVWATPYPDFQTSGSLEEYDASGTLLQTVNAGIAPNDVAFVTD